MNSSGLIQGETEGEIFQSVQVRVLKIPQDFKIETWILEEFRKLFGISFYYHEYFLDSLVFFQECLTHMNLIMICQIDSSQ